jgi:hypothetical protein
MTWVLIAWSVLVLVWVIVGVNSADCENEEFQDACEAGTGLGVGVILFLGFMGFVVLALVWFMTRPREARVVNAGPPAGQFVSSTVNRPPPSGASPPAGWYPDPTGKFDQRWFDGRWTDHVAKHGDNSTYTDPMPGR